MLITSKGQVTIPQKYREQLGLLPNTEVEFELHNGHLRIKKAHSRRGRQLIEQLAGTARPGLSTRDIMKLTRGEESA